MHAMRTIDHYDDAHEAERAAEYRAQLARETKRKSANALAVLAGHLPAAVQEEIGRELGIIPARLTIISALGVYAVLIALALWIGAGLVPLLSPADQARVAARFGYDYRHQSSLIAILILFFAAIGVATSLHRGAVISLIAATVIAAEQIYRLAILRSRPAGSILGIAARPFVRKLL